MGIGTLRCHVIDVNDLAVAEAFWSEVTGLPVIPAPFPSRFSYLGQANPWHHEVILQLVSATKGSTPNGSHVDIWVRDVDIAITQIEAIGGRTKKAPSIYARPHSGTGEAPLIDWAVMQDPFGHEFCLVSQLTPDQTTAVTRAGAEGDGDDHHWRVAAGRAAP